MKSSELNRMALKDGWLFLYQIGSHRYYEKDGKVLCIPFHGSKEVPTGTCNRILKEMGRK